MRGRIRLEWFAVVVRSPGGKPDLVTGRGMRCRYETHAYRRWTDLALMAMLCVQSGIRRQAEPVIELQLEKAGVRLAS